MAAYVAAGGDEQVQRVTTAVNRVGRQLDRWYATQLAGVGLTADEWAVLTRLARAGGETLTPSQLAEQTSVAPSSMTHRLDKLVDKGLVSRGPDPDSRARVLVTLSREGWESFREAMHALDRVERDVLAVLDSAQRDQLAALLDLVIGGIDDLVEPATLPR
ncbi:MarR family transcriptional regulator [Arsenicicoccus sp. oral taxon 190]|nr:MarR family transcriptional regulator [Arsenicicoccus sp. oral taxon 190]